MKKIFFNILTITILAAVLIGCGQKTPGVDNDNNDVALSDIQEAVQVHLGENYLPNMDIDESQLGDIIGLDIDEIEEYIAQVPMISAHVDTFIAVKAKDGEADDVEDDLVKYRANIVENSIQYPGNLAKVNASEVVRHGDYVFFIMLGSFDEREDVSEAEQLEFAQKETSEIKEVISKFFN